MGQGMRGGQPLSAFPELSHLIDHDPWFAGRDVRVHSVWDRVRTGYDLYGSALHYHGYVICSRRRSAFLVLVMRQDCPRPVYVNRYKNSADAQEDSVSLAREIELRAPLNHQVWGGSDHVHGTWCVRVVRRLHHVELQFVRGGLIPYTTRHHDTVDEAMLDAERCITDRYLTN
jgi:hypothetical protein